MNGTAGPLLQPRLNRGIFLLVEEITFCPGFARGLSIVGDYALIGLSLPRDNKTFSGLPLDDALNARDVSARCG